MVALLLGVSVSSGTVTQLGRVAYTCMAATHEAALNGGAPVPWRAANFRPPSPAPLPYRRRRPGCLSDSAPSPLRLAPGHRPSSGGPLVARSSAAQHSGSQALSGLHTSSSQLSGSLSTQALRLSSQAQHAALRLSAAQCALSAHAARSAGSGSAAQRSVSQRSSAPLSTCAQRSTAQPLRAYGWPSAQLSAPPRGETLTAGPQSAQRSAMA